MYYRSVCKNVVFSPQYQERKKKVVSNDRMCIKQMVTYFGIASMQKTKSTWI